MQQRWDPPTVKTSDSVITHATDGFRSKRNFKTSGFDDILKKEYLRNILSLVKIKAILGI